MREDGCFTLKPQSHIERGGGGGGGAEGGDERNERWREPN